MDKNKSNLKEKSDLTKDIKKYLYLLRMSRFWKNKAKQYSIQDIKYELCRYVYSGGNINGLRKREAVNKKQEKDIKRDYKYNPYLIVSSYLYGLEVYKVLDKFIDCYKNCDNSPKLLQPTGNFNYRKVYDLEESIILYHKFTKYGNEYYKKANDCQIRIAKKYDIPSEKIEMLIYKYFEVEYE